MRPGATMVVPSGFTTTITNITMFSCPEMGNGIDVMGGGTLIVNGNSTIMAQLKAINLRPNSALSSIGTTFLNNYIDLNANFSSFSSANILAFRNNVFNAPSASTIPAFSGSGVTVSDIGFVGIRLINYNDFKILSGTNNIFSNLANGILAQNSNLQIFDARFTNMIAATPAYSLQGFGIRAIGMGKSNWMNIGREHLPFINFENCTTGIYAQSMAGAIDKTNMTGVVTGIHWGGSPNRDIFMRKNNITATRYGIRSSLNEPLVLQSRMSENTILVSGNNTYGINAQEYWSAPKGGWLMNANTVSVQGDGDGIYYRNGKTGALVNNTVNVPTSATGSQGIYLQYTQDADVVGNTVNDGNDGIYLEANERDTVQCNILDGADAGIHVVDMNNLVRLMGNEMKNHTNGLEYGTENRPEALTGEQRNLGNKWDNATMGSWGAFYHGGGFDNSKFIVDADENPDFLPELINPNLWFVPFSTPTLSYYCPQPPGIEPHTPDGHDEKVVDGTFGHPKFPESMLWRGEYRLYRKMLQIPSIQNYNTRFQNWKSTQADLPAGQLAWVAEEINDLFALETGDLQALTNLRQQVVNRTEDLLELDSLRNLGANVNATTYSNAKQKQEQAIEDYETFINQLELNQQSEASTLRTINNAIQVDDIWQNNHQIVNDIGLQLVATPDNWNTSMIASLEDIARQCPEAGGDAVYEARAMLSWVMDIEYDDETVCYEAEAQERQGEKIEFNTKTRQKIEIFPNPVSDVLYWKGYSGETVNVLIYDRLGRLIKQEYTVSQRVSTRDLYEGIYRIHIFKDNRLVYNNNFIKVEN